MTAQQQSQTKIRHYCGIVLCADILGMSQVFRKNKNYVSTLYKLQQKVKKSMGNDMPLRNCHVFSDSIVAFENVPFDIDDLESGLYNAMSQFAGCQLSAACKYHHMIRGGISYGDIGVCNDFISGEGVTRAAQFDSHGTPPVVQIDKYIIERARSVTIQMRAGQTNKAFDTFAFGLQNWIFYDRKNQIVFLNYLNASTEVDAPEKTLQAHKDFILEGLQTENGSVFMKYKYLSEYHNHFIAESKFSAKLKINIPSKNLFQPVDENAAEEIYLESQK